MKQYMNLGMELETTLEDTLDCYSVHGTIMQLMKFQQIIYLVNVQSQYRRK